jgi:mannan polymerase II complex MNN10 subunit
MTLSRSPSPNPEGGWSSPGLEYFGSGSGRESPSDGFRPTNANNVTWATAKKKTEMVNGTALSQAGGYFKRHMRQLSSSLPTFAHANETYYEKDKPTRGAWNLRDGSILGRIRNTIERSWRRSKLRFILGITLFLIFLVWWTTRKPLRTLSCTALFPLLL